MLHNGGAGGAAAAGAGANPKAAKLTIKLASRPELPATFLQSSWESLRAALVAIRSRKRSAESEEHLYSLVESITLNKQGAQLYELLAKDVTSRVTELFASGALPAPAPAGSGAGATPAATSASGGLPEEEGPALLAWTAHTWNSYTQEMRSVRMIFLYLDARLPSGTASLYDMGLSKFKAELARHEGAVARVVASALEQVDRARRDGEDDPHVYDCVRMLSLLGMYASDFEPAFFAATARFYTEEGEDLLKSANLAEYVRHVSGRLAYEHKRDFLEPVTRLPLQAIVDRVMIQERAQQLLAPARLDPLLTAFQADGVMAADAAAEENLSLLFAAFKRTNQLDALRARFGEFLRARGAEAVAETDPVPAVIKLHVKAGEMVRRCFQKDDAFTRTFREAFEHFMNADGTKTAELLAKYVDARLRGKTPDEADLARVVDVFRHLHGKDVFEEFYKQQLAKRLLLNTSASQEAELGVVARLKRECGAGFTNKLEGMFRDVELSKSMQADWARVSPQVAGAPPNQHSVHVLSMGYWPSYPDFPSFVVPASLREVQASFETFYKTAKNYADRRLSWKHTLGHCLLRARLPSGRYELDVSTFQAAVLLKFDERAEWVYEALKEATGIPDDELQRTLTSMALGKPEQRVLVLKQRGSEATAGGGVAAGAGVAAPAAAASGGADKADKAKGGGEDNDDSDADEEEEDAGEGAGAEPRRLVRPGDVFAVNLAFKSKRVRLKINQIQIKETKKENKETHAKVQQDRQYQIDAAIVRIMKARKHLSHNMLVAELFKQLAFPTKPHDLKKRIESLIEREYLERSAEDTNDYVYLA